MREGVEAEGEAVNEMRPRSERDEAEGGEKGGGGGGS